MDHPFCQKQGEKCWTKISASALNPTPEESENTVGGRDILLKGGRTETINRVTRQPMEWETMFAHHTRGDPTKTGIIFWRAGPL